MKCKYEIDGICVNDQSPLCCDDCLVSDVEGVCKHEDREEG